MTVKPWQRLVAEIESLAAPGGRARQQSCVVEGIRLVERALRAGAELTGAVAVDSFLSDPSSRYVALRSELAQRRCEPVEVADEVMARLTDGRSLGGIVAMARLPQRPTLAEILQRAAASPRFVVCVSFNDPGNVGALVRTAHASGASAILATGSTDVFHPKGVRTSMGSVFRMPVLEWPDLASLAEQLRAHGVRSLGAVTDNGTPLPDLEHRDRPLAIVLGSEAFGLDEAERRLLDELVTIPMAEDVDSFSVNAAAAVLLYELRSRT